MWESPIYKFEEEVTDKNGKIVKRQFSINTTYSAPRNLDDPGKALKAVFKKITEGLTPSETHILDFGAAKLRNTLWLLQKGFHVWAVEFPELKERLKDAKEKWDLAETYPNFHHVTFPNDFIKLKKKSFDIIMLIKFKINFLALLLFSGRYRTSQHKSCQILHHNLAQSSLCLPAYFQPLVRFENWMRPQLKPHQHPAKFSSPSRLYLPKLHIYRSRRANSPPFLQHRQLFRSMGSDFYNLLHSLV